MKRVAIVAAKRTPMGSFLGGLSGLAAPQLGSVAIKAAVEQSKVPGNQIDEALIGNVLAAGQGQAPARQAVLGAGLPEAVPCTTVNKVCGSGMKTIMMGADSIKVGFNNVVLCGGLESMSNAPYLLKDARKGHRMGNKPAIDSMVHDGLWDPYDNVHMGNCGEICADEYKFTREEQDAYALQSLEYAKKAQAEGVFGWEMAPVTIKGRKGDTVFEMDESPGQAMPDKISKLKPAFKKDGSVTAANASTINDGASALVIAGEDTVQSLGLTPIAWITGYAQHAQTPKYFTTAPGPAVSKLLDQVAWKAGDVDLWEINEAFAVVTMAAIKDLNLARDRVNVFGGATALGHPIGSSGSRIVVTLLNALRHNQKQRGIATLCIGGGEATAIAVEMA
eukprot:Hpha_TRINITY_DN13731_c0_g1::TRINITY_DN13731_c0_g1_i1::g.142193::m.142193/K00626/E2.3.1.9, atoB; acetyl-CoA C-acetyltransferase